MITELVLDFSDIWLHFEIRAAPTQVTEAKFRTVSLAKIMGGPGEIYR